MYPKSWTRGHPRESRKRRGWISQNFPSSLIINPSPGMDQEIHPCRRKSIDSAQINPFLVTMREWVVQCIRAPPKWGRYWKIHPRRQRYFPRPLIEGQGKSWGRREWISQYLPSFGEVRTFYHHHHSFDREWIMKSFPVGREGLTALKSILPCWWWKNL